MVLADVIDQINSQQMTDWNYNGVIDITEVINFQDMGLLYDLTTREYERLIDRAQKLATKKLNSYNPTNGFELKV
jgi:hypothetical protein